MPINKDPLTDLFSFRNLVVQGRGQASIAPRQDFYHLLVLYSVFLFSFLMIYMFFNDVYVL